MIYTFYSFKGGVGRSMAMANIAELLYRRGLDVLMVDFDLEAPGLERFFDGDEVQTKPDQALRSRGILDLMLSYKMLRDLQLPPPTGSAESANTPPPLNVEPLANFVVPIYPKVEEEGEKERTDRKEAKRGTLSLVGAGRRDDDEYSVYADRVRSLDWGDFYLKYEGERFFDWFAAQAQNLAEVVLIDSRTGLTEMSGVCTHHLADVVVLLVAANQQNVDGCVRIARSLSRSELVSEGRKGRPLSLLVAPSRVEPGEGDKLDAFAALFQEQFAGFIDSRLSFHTSAFVDLKIPYIPYYAYMEKVAMREPDSPKAADLIAAFGKVATAMVDLAPPTGDLYRIYHALKTEPAAVSTDVDFPPPPSHFTGREWAFERIDAWLAAPEPRCLLITGGPGSGKTSLVARLLQLTHEPTGSESDSQLGSGSVTFAYACTGVPDEAIRFVSGLTWAFARRSAAFTQALAHSGQERPGMVRVQLPNPNADQRAPSGPSLQSLELRGLSPEVAMRYLVERPLQELHAAGSREPFLIVVDGLDATRSSSDDEDSLLTLISTLANADRLPVGVRFLMTSRHVPRVLQAVTGAMLDLENDAPGRQDDIRAYVEERLPALPEADRRALASRVSDVAAGTFVFAKVAVDELVAGGGRSEDVLSRADEILSPAWSHPSLSDIFRRSLKASLGSSVERWADRYRPLFGALAVVRDPGLTVSQLAALTGRTRTKTADALRSIAPHLVGTMPDGPFKLFHQAFVQFLLSDPEYRIDAAESHAAVARSFLAQHEGEWERCEDEYALANTAGHLIEAIRLTSERRARQELQLKLSELLGDFDFVETVLAHGLLDRLVPDVTAAVPLGLRNESELEGLVAFLSSERDALASWDRERQPDLFAERLQAPGGETRLRNLAAVARRRLGRDAAPPPGTEVGGPRDGETLVSGPEQPFRDPGSNVVHSSAASEQARLVGKFWLAFSLGVCAVASLMAISEEIAASYPPAFRRTLAFLVFLGAVFSMSHFLPRALVFRQFSLAHQGEGSQETPGGPKRFRLLGGLYAASPYFELATVVWVLCFFLLSFSEFMRPIDALLSLLRAMSP